MDSQASREWPLDEASLRKARGYLEGLALILDEFNVEERGKDQADPLAERLQHLQTPGIEWAALRYQFSVGTGWLYMADSVREVLHTLPPVDPDDLDYEQ